MAMRREVIGCERELTLAVFVCDEHMGSDSRTMIGVDGWAPEMMRSAFDWRRSTF